MYWLVIKSFAGLDVPSSDSYYRDNEEKNYKQTYTHTHTNDGLKEIPRKKKFRFNGNCYTHLMEVEKKSKKKHALSSSHSKLPYIENENLCVFYG